MRPRQTLAFIAGVLLCLTLLCAVFPGDGVRALGLTLRFPALQTVLGGAEEDGAEEEADTAAAPSPEELLQKRLDDLRAREEGQFRDYCRSNPARIHLPGDGETYLDTLFSQLRDCSSRHLRVMHYGDSQIECDRITGYLRQELQEAFGGCGVGLIPALQTVPTYTTLSSVTPDGLAQEMPYGPPSARGEDNLYGPMARRTLVTDSATVTFRSRGGKDYSRSRAFRRVTVITARPASLSLLAGGEEAPLEAEGGEGPCFYTARLPRPATGGELRVGGPASILGIQLDGETGVSVDNIPMRGCSGAELAAIGRASLQPFFRRENVALVILQFGGNAIPYLSEEQLPALARKVRRMCALFRSLKPSARLLFIGPGDMAEADGQGGFRSYPILPAATRAMREAALAEGAAFWDMYAAMGGRGSILRWEAARPQLAGSDHVHFTPLGARRVAHMLHETLQLYYRFYRLRAGLDAGPRDAADSATASKP